MGTSPHNPQSLWGFYIKENRLVLINQIQRQHEKARRHPAFCLQNTPFRGEDNHCQITFNEVLILNEGHDVIYFDQLLFYT